MQKRESQPLAEAMRDFFEQNPMMKIRFAEHRVVDGWRQALGNAVSDYTRKVYLRNDILYVHLSSSVLRAQLLLDKQNLIKRLNEYAGMPVITDIVVR